VGHRPHKGHFGSTVLYDDISYQTEQLHLSSSAGQKRVRLVIILLFKKMETVERTNVPSLCSIRSPPFQEKESDGKEAAKEKKPFSINNKSDEHFFV
jgi:mevalonate pyrophosphate decarboxylase